MANGIININRITVEDLEQYTVLKLVYKLIGKTNELVDSTNDIYEKLDYLLKDGLSKEVAETLTQWLNDGTLAEIISQDVLNELSSEIDKLNDAIDTLKDANGLSEIHMICMDYINTSNLIVTKDNQVIMIDCGGDPESGENSHLALESHMARLGITKIDIMIFTHAHTDHMGNAPYFIQKYHPKYIVTKIIDWNSLPEIESSYGTVQCFLNMKAEADALGIPIIEAKDQPVIQLNDDESLRFINTTWVDVTNYNGSSLLVMYQNKSKKVLFSGDSNGANQANIPGNVSCDIERLGHHGNSDSLSEDWLKRTRPRIAVGDNLNIPGILTVSDLYRFYNAKILTCSENWGCVSFGVGGNQIVSFNRDSSLADSPWVVINGKYGYVYPDTRVAHNEFVSYNGGLASSFIKENYYMAQSEYFSYKGNEYYANANGIILQNGWLIENSFVYYYDEYGCLVKNGTKRIEGQYYTFNINGVCTNPPENLQ